MLLDIQPPLGIEGTPHQEDLFYTEDIHIPFLDHMFILIGGRDRADFKSTTCTIRGKLIECLRESKPETYERDVRALLYVFYRHIYLGERNGWPQLQ